ncbi:MAG: methionine--tRNA ligase subunit beta, partial [Lachnospiraceae bacterium]|nr:methionine--tRNA ligase subunit beta [Lachnospiraceae bacterium]
HEMPFENDGVITWDLLIERINTDLANVLGNLLNRTVAMSNKYFGGAVRNGNVSEPVDEELAAVAKDVPARCEKAMETLHVADALTEIWNLFKRLNKYIDETMPWALAKDPEKADRLATVLYNLSEGLSIGASLLAPFLPDTAEKILAQLGTEKRAFARLGEFGLNPETKVTETPSQLFARLDPAAVLKKVEELFPAPKAEAPAADTVGADAHIRPELIHKELVEYDDFAKLEFRVGKVLVCEEVPKSKKLLRFEIDFGGEKRQIISGIKHWYKAEEMVGKKVMAVVNLKPAKLAGYLSEGMLLSAEDANGDLSLMSPERNVLEGAEIR